MPYQGGSQALVDLESGRVHVMFSNPVPLLPYVRAGKVTLIGMATAKRFPTLPDVPTLREQGQMDFVVNSWSGVLAPAGTDPAIVRKLSSAFTEVMSAKGIQETLLRQGTLATPLDAPDFRRYLVKEEGRWRTIIEQTGFTNGQ